MNEGKEAQQIPSTTDEHIKVGALEMIKAGTGGGSFQDVLPLVWTQRSQEISVQWDTLPAPAGVGVSVYGGRWGSLEYERASRVSQGWCRTLQGAGK